MEGEFGLTMTLHQESIYALGVRIHNVYRGLMLYLIPNLCYGFE